MHVVAFAIVHRLFRSLDDGNKNEKVCSHSKQYTSRCLTSLFCANSLSAQHTAHTFLLAHSLPLRSHSALKLCAIRLHLSRFWHLFSLYFTLSLAVLEIVFCIRARSEFQHLFCHDKERSAKNTSSTVSKTITCEKRDVPHANHKTFHFICVCNNFACRYFGGNSLEWTKNVGECDSKFFGNSKQNISRTEEIRARHLCQFELHSNFEVLPSNILTYIHNVHDGFIHRHPHTCRRTWHTAYLTGNVLCHCNKYSCVAHCASLIITFSA